MAARAPTPGEQLVIEELLRATNTHAPALRVHDTGPGTSIIAQASSLTDVKPSGAPVATIGFWDDDAVPVFFDLFVDASGRFAEIDVWKARGSPVIRWPTERQEILDGSALYEPPARG